MNSLPVNHTLATLSDVTYASAFAVYFIALVLAIIYYAKHAAVLDAQQAAMKEKALVGAPSAPAPAENPRAGSAERFGNMAQTMVWLGIVLHAASIVLRGASARRFPFGNLYEYVSIISLGVVLITAIVVVSRGIMALWPWILTPVIALMFFGGTRLYAESAPVVPALQSLWFPIHVSTVVVGASICMISGMASLVYLFRTKQPKGEESANIWGTIARPLPRADMLDQIAYKTAIWALPIFGLGIALGAIWAESAWGRFWGWDPKETMSFVTWVLLAAYLHARATPSWKRTTAAWINVVCFGAMVFNLFFINLVTSGLHSYAGLN